MSRYDPIGLETVAFDLSIILNVHDEARYLARTLRSTVESARFARSLGARSQLVVVLDRPTADIERQISGFSSSVFADIQCVKVDHGSLGPSRNAGVAAACGEFVTTCDADDLISFNAFAAMLDVARQNGPNTVVVAEFVFAFGQEDWVGHYSDYEAVTPLRFVLYNPFPARILAPRELLVAHPYSNIPIGGPFAFEDWHQNCELIAAGVRYSVAPDTILFYRRRTNSLSVVFDRTSPRVTPPSRFFHPAFFLKAGRSGYRRYQDPAALESDAATVRQRLGFLDGALCRELVYQANQIDPAIDVRRYDASRSYGTRSFPIGPGLAYYRLCEALGPEDAFSDVVLASGRCDDYAAWYMSQVLEALRTIEPGTRILILAERSADLAPLERYAPPGSVLVALDRLQPDLDEATIDVLVVKIMQAVAPEARVHFGRSSFATRFWRRFASVLPGVRTILYRFHYRYDDVEGRAFVFDEDLDLISDCLPTFKVLLADRQDVRDRDCHRIGVVSERWHLLPPPAGDSLSTERQSTTRRRIIWLSEAAEQLRADVPALADALANLGVRLAIDSWPVPYRGDASGDARPDRAASLAAAVDLSDVLCILFTPKGSGLRRHLLDALGAGLPVIAAADSGAEDLVRHDVTGLCLSLSPGHDEFVSTCAAAIAGIAEDGDRWARLSEGARALIAAHHTPQLFHANVRRILVD